MESNLIKEWVFIAIVVMLLLALIFLSALKISIFFSSFLFLSKKKNYDKANYIANSSFYQYFYNNPFLFGEINIEKSIAAFLIALLVVAIIGNLGYGATNYGYLNYYYGDYDEYNFVDYYIKIIMILGVIYFLSYLNWFWFSNDKAEDDKLLTNEVALKAFVIENIDYTYLYDYYINVIFSKASGAYDINSYIKTYKKGYALKDQNTLFKLCFTIHILSPSRTEFANIQAEIFSICKITYEKSTTTEQATAAAFAPKITQALKDNTFYIIANYNNNNSAVLPPLEKLVKDTLSSVSDAKIKEIRDTKLKAIQTNSPDISTMKSTYEQGRSHFTDTIKVYKEVYGKYYTYYIYSVLITNFLLTYSILIFLYIIIKFQDGFDKPLYSIYSFKSDIKTYGYYILGLYYLLTSPIILFGAS
jgi:hypothetical protein